MTADSLAAVNADAGLAAVAAWACWFAATEDQKAKSLVTEAKLPIDLVRKVVASGRGGRKKPRELAP